MSAFVPARVAAYAEADPFHVAVVDSTSALTYAELVRRASSLAARLRAAGVSPGSCVALYLDRSAEFVAAALGVLWAGAAYLPIDTESPVDRLAYVLTDADVATVVTSGLRQRHLPEAHRDAHLIDVPDEVAGASAPDPPAARGLDDLAYVIYTSGSTGRPKGVELTHGNLANLVDWHIAAFDVGPGDRASQVASVGFDAAVWEIWPQLAAGAAVYLADDETRRSPQRVRDWLVEQEITIAFVPTVLAEQVIHLPWPPRTALRTMLTGADVLHRRPPSDVPFRLVNNYGPTECTVVATSGAVAPDGPGSQERSAPSVGRPISNAAALVLNGELRPVPPGEPGELCLAGALLGRGYRNDPALTAERFVDVPSSDGGGRLRVYRTGDQVRLLEDGEIAFLGRLDKQVKIRGFRVEPAEVVTAINLFPGVTASAVVAHSASDDDPGSPAEPELVAYVVSGEGLAVPTAPDLRAFLPSRLPDYMVPARFVSIDALPLTINGKLDEAALPARAAENLLEGEPGPAASSGGSVVEQVSEIVRTLLNLPAIGPTENIFLVGGHSMLAMQVVLRIRQTFGVKLALRQVFVAPTIDGLAAEIIRRMASGDGAGGER